MPMGGPSAEATPCHHEPAHAVASSALQSLEASGMPRWEAIGLIALALGQQSVMDECAGFISGGPEEDEIRKALDGIAAHMPDFANDLFQRWFAGPGISSLFVSDRLAWPRRIPGGLVVDRGIHLSRCHALERIGDGLRTGQNFTLEECPSLTRLPDSLDVGGAMTIRHCASLRSIGKHSVIGGDLTLWDASQFDEFPERLRVGGDLHIAGCPSMVHLPYGLEVGGDLKIEGCPTWDGVIPWEARIGGHAYVDSERRKWDSAFAPTTRLPKRPGRDGA